MGLELNVGIGRNYLPNQLVQGQEKGKQPIKKDKHHGEAQERAGDESSSTRPGQDREASEAREGKVTGQGPG